MHEPVHCSYSQVNQLILELKYYEYLFGCTENFYAVADSGISLTIAVFFPFSETFNLSVL